MQPRVKNLILFSGLFIAIVGLLLLLSLQSQPTNELNSKEPIELIEKPSANLNDVASNALTNDELDTWTTKTDDEVDPKISVKDTALFDLIAEEGVRSIHILERGDGNRTFIREYDPNEPLFYSDPNAKIIFNLYLPKDMLLTPEALQNFYRNIHLVWDKEGIKNNIRPDMDGIGEQSFNRFDIILRDQPLTDLEVRFQTDDRQKSKSFILNYVEPFTFDIQSWDPAKSEVSFKLAEHDAPYFTHHVLLDQPYELKVTFSTDVDRASVEQKLAVSFIHDEEWSIDWIHDRMLKLTIRFTQREVSTTLHMDGIRSQAGYELKTDKILSVRADHPQQVQHVQVDTGEKTVLFSNITHYSGFHVSPDGKWFLGYRYPEGDHAPFPQHWVLFNKQGEILDEFEKMELFLPNWLPDEDAFVYYDDGMLMKYDVHLAKSETLWRFKQVDQPFMNPDGLAVDPNTGRIAVSLPFHYEEEYYEADLYLFDHAQDKQPRIVERYKRDLCIHVCQSHLDFAGSDNLVYRSVEPLEEQYHFDWKIHVLKWEDLTDASIADYMDNEMHLQMDSLLLRNRHEGQWQQYHLETGTIVPLAWDFDAPYRIVRLETGQFLFYIYGDGWYKAGLDEEMVLPVTDLDGILPEKVSWIDIFGDELYFSERE